MRDDARARDIAQEDEEDDDHEPHADQQVVQHVVRRHVNQLGSLVEDPDSHTDGKQVRSWISSSFFLTASETGSDFSYFRIRTMPSTTSFSFCGPAPAHDPQARLMAFHDLGDVADQDRIASSDGSTTTLRMSSSFWSIVGPPGDVRRVERVDPLSQQPDSAHDVRLAAEGEDVASDVGVGLLNRVLHLLQRDPVMVQLPDRRARGIA